MGLRLKKYSSKAALLAGASALVFVSSVFILAVWNMRLLSAFSGFLNVNRDVFTLTLVSRAVFAFCIAVRAVRARNVCSAFFLFLVFSVRIDNFTLFNYYLILLSYTVHLYISRPGYNYSAGQEA
ncbi:MAG TPA: hypothetical protein DC049_10460 [Spirochaetia bacterium]|nr:hypothetical protein [Spirochaetia bacterium]